MSQEKDRELGSISARASDAPEVEKKLHSRFIPIYDRNDFESALGDTASSSGLLRLQESEGATESRLLGGLGSLERELHNSGHGVSCFEASICAPLKWTACGCGETVWSCESNGGNLANSCMAPELFIGRSPFTGERGGLQSFKIMPEARRADGITRCMFRLVSLDAYALATGSRDIVSCFDR